MTKPDNDKDYGSDDLDLYPVSSLVSVLKTTAEDLLHRALAEREPLLFRARFLHDPSERLASARTWTRWSEPDDDDELGVEPTIEAAVPLPWSQYLNLVGPADRAVFITVLILEDDDRSIDLMPKEQAVRFDDLLVDEEVWERFTGQAAPTTRKSDATKIRMNDLRIMNTLIRLVLKSNPAVFGTAEKPKLSALAAALRKEADFAGFTRASSLNTFTGRLKAAMALAPDPSDESADE